MKRVDFPEFGGPTSAMRGGAFDSLPSASTAGPLAASAWDIESAGTALGGGPRGESHAEAARKLTPQREHVTIHADDGVAGRGKTHRTELAARQDAALEKWLHLIRGEIDPNELHDLS